MTRGKDCCLTNGKDRNGGCRTPPDGKETLLTEPRGLHRNSHSASREQPQSRKTGETSIRRNIPVIRTIPCAQIVCPRGHHVPFPTRYFDLDSASNVRTARLGLKKHTASWSRASWQNVVPPKSVRHTGFLKDDKDRRAGAEGIWSPPAQQGNHQRKLPPSCW